MTPPSFSDFLADFFADRERPDLTSKEEPMPSNPNPFLSTDPAPASSPEARVYRDRQRRAGFSTAGAIRRSAPRPKVARRGFSK